MAGQRIYEIFGMRLRVVKDDGYHCDSCALLGVCKSPVVCRDAHGNLNRHFEKCEDN